MAVLVDKPQDQKDRPLTPEEIDELEHIFHGPTWQRRSDNGKWLLPERTLGWEIAGWCARYLRAEDSTDEDPKPWRFTKEQLRFILWWYAVDENGRFVYRKGVLQRMKGWGKDPLLAVMCLVELCGPSRVKRDRFGMAEWNDEGNPIGQAHPQAWVQVTAVNQSQTTNTMALIPSLMSDEFKATYRIKDGAELIRANGGKQRLEAVTSSYRALEGKRTTFTLLNETHHWVTGNDGHKMYETIDGNATKKDARYLAITNAYLPGENSVAEKMRESWDLINEGAAVDIGFLYDTIEAHPKTPLTPEALAIVLPKIRGDAIWLRVETIIQSVLDLTMSASRSRRMWLNQIVAEEDAIYSTADWDPLAIKTALKPGDEIVMGFDGGKTSDSTALVAIRVKDGVAFLLGVWEKPSNWPKDRDAAKWHVPREKVDSAVHEAFQTYKVRGFYADVALWESYIADWEGEYAEKLSVKSSLSSPIGWDMRQSLQRVTRAHERLVQSILDGKLRHNGDVVLRRHVLNTRRRTNNYGMSFGKESKNSPRKVDAYAALLLAHIALNELRTRGKTPEKERSTRGYFI